MRTSLLITALLLTALPARAQTAYTDYRGVIHNHSHFSHDSEGTEEEVVAAATSAGLDFLVMTDHQNDDRSVTHGIRGRRGNTLFVVGAEVGAGSGASLLGIDLVRHVKGKGPEAKIADVVAQGGQAWLGHAEGWGEWDLEGVTGVELYNLHYDALKENKLRVARGLARAARHILTDPDRAFRQILDRPDPIIAKWDRITQKRRFPIVAGNDAHQNIEVLGRQLDPFARSYRFVNTHVLVRGELTKQALLEGLANGHAYICHEMFADGRGFSFTALDPKGSQLGMMGDELAFSSGLVLQVTTPQPVPVRLFRNGRVLARSEGAVTEWAFSPTQAGVYRVELTIVDQADDERVRPWIYSNPIYVRPRPRPF